MEACESLSIASRKLEEVRRKLDEARQKSFQRLLTVNLQERREGRHWRYLVCDDAHRCLYVVQFARDILRISVVEPFLIVDECCKTDIRGFPPGLIPMIAQYASDFGERALLSATSDEICDMYLARNGFLFYTTPSSTVQLDPRTGIS